MSKRHLESQGFLPLKPRVFHMLLILAGGQRHGYGLREELTRQTEGRISLGPGTLYRTIRWMLEHNLVTESSDRPSPSEDDERRRYYRITDLGRRVAGAEAKRLDALVGIARAERLIR